MKSGNAAIFFAMVVLGWAAGFAAFAQPDAASMEATAKAHCEAEGKQFRFKNQVTSLLAGAPAAATYAITGQCVGPGDPGYDPTLAGSPMTRSALTGVEEEIDWVYALHPDCSLSGIPVVVTRRPPQHGNLRVANGQEYPAYSADNQRYACNMKKAPAALIYYKSTDAYVGPDSFELTVIFPNGSTMVIDYNLDVVPTPSYAK